MTDEPDPAAIEAFVHLLKAQPTLLDPAPDDGAGLAINRRTRDEVHSCLRCGKRAQVAYIACLRTGPGWLDLCAACTRWLRRGLDVLSRNDDPFAGYSIGDWFS